MYVDSGDVFDVPPVDITVSEAVVVSVSMFEFPFAFDIPVGSDSLACPVFVPVEEIDPALWIMEPSLRERISVDSTPGREVRWERVAIMCCGTCYSVARMSGLDISLQKG